MPDIKKSWQNGKRVVASAIYSDWQKFGPIDRGHCKGGSETHPYKKT